MPRKSIERQSAEMLLIQPYRLTRDGEEIMVGTELEILTYIHRKHSYSMQHALEHEGYRLEPVGELPKGA